MNFLEWAFSENLAPDNVRMLEAKLATVDPVSTLAENLRGQIVQTKTDGNNKLLARAAILSVVGLTGYAVYRAVSTGR